jgi:glycosyltransferase involved in cell wall biosynthesis
VATTPLLVFADDWGRHPSSCQHLIRHLLDRHTVHWVNTIGTRRPRLDLATLRRAVGKVWGWLRPGRAASAVPDNLHVHNPRMWPSFASGLARGLNRRLLRRQLAGVLRSLPEPPVAVTTIPLVADLLDDLAVRHWVYYCVDDFSVWPGLDGRTLLEMEQHLIPRADVLIAASEVLRQRLAQGGRDAALLTHGVDLSFWSGGGQAPPCLDGLERPLIVFWGLVDRRLDLAFLRRLTAALRQGTVVLAGPHDQPDPELSTLPRLVRVGSLPFGELPGLARAAAVLIMPYADLPVTRAMQPLKLKEYLATERPVVVADLPANREWADCLDLASSPDAFARQVLVRLEGGLPEEQRLARARLGSEAWETKARLFEQLLTGAAPEGAVRPAVAARESA